ncbi:boophilin-H2-like [Dermacentor silvarum]|uniref:boophilin-H2-like n=1 Tax=Dermacentor silvarum TaxID=543639 RepID=UPI001896D107|nr:boophilin-H2-like [Dermacentor silvarum]
MIQAPSNRLVNFFLLLCSYLVLAQAYTAVTSYRCYKPLEAGICGARIPRWYYDLRSGTCKVFTYSGCGGNSNNFASELKCQKECIPRHLQRIVCSQFPMPRPCNFGPHWHFDPITNTCNRYPWGRCGSNANRFPSCEACMRRCTNYRARDACRELMWMERAPTEPTELHYQ